MKSRSLDQLREVRIEKFPPSGNVPGSVLFAAGRTQVLCVASLTTDLPPHLKPKPGEAPTQGWVTAEYNMLPGSTPQRKKRGPDSRGTEIQRLIGRSLRAAVNMTKMPGLCITVDCDVLVADGGTRTASITGGFVALALALREAASQGMLQGDPIKGVGPVAAVSVGIVDGRVCLDLDYALDSQAQVDMNVVMNAGGKCVEIQGCAEQGAFDRKQLDTMLTLASRGISQLIRKQRAFLRD